MDPMGFVMTSLWNLFMWFQITCIKGTITFWGTDSLFPAHGLALFQDLREECLRCKKRKQPLDLPLIPSNPFWCFILGVGKFPHHFLISYDVYETVKHVQSNKYIEREREKERYGSATVSLKFIGI